MDGGGMLATCSSRARQVARPRRGRSEAAADEPAGRLTTLVSVQERPAGGAARCAAASTSADGTAAPRAEVGRRLRLALCTAVEVGNAGERRIRGAGPEPRRGVDDAGVGREQAADEPGLPASRTG